MQVRVADYIAGHLDRIGVRAAFLLSGGMMMHLMDAVSRQPNIRYYCHHHEQAAAMAADAYARKTGSLGLCLATSGPGATNLLTGIVGAWQDSSPVLFLTGQSKLKETIRGSGIAGLRQFGVFEVDILPMVESVTKYTVFLSDPLSARYHLERAIHLATSGRPGPVLIDIPLDVQAALVNPETLRGYDAPETSPHTDLPGILQTASELRFARRPLILAGQGVRIAGAADAFERITRQLGVPVVTTQMAKDLLPQENPLLVGHPGHKGDRAANFAVQTADFILSIGCSLHIQTTGYERDRFAPQANKIMVELDPAIRARENCGFHHKIAMDAGVFLAELERVWTGGHWSPADLEDWKQRCQQWKVNYSPRREKHVTLGRGEAANLYEFVEVLSDSLRGTETLVLDAGQSYYAVPHNWHLQKGQRYLCSGALGSMGVAVPFSIGAAAADPGAQVVCVTGDGSFHMNVQELQTIRHNNLNVKIFVMDNDGYASIRGTQRNFFAGHFVGSTVESGVSLPAVEKVAQLYGIPYVSCPERRWLSPAIRRALAQKGPVICGVKTLPDQAILPGVPSFQEADGRMQSKALHEMNPALPDRETREAMTF